MSTSASDTDDRSLFGDAAGSDVEAEVGRRLEALKSARIMMVDDEPTTIEVLEAFLEGEGYENIVTSTDSREALALARRTRPDCVLLDFNMPHVDGLEILRSIRNDPELERTPVIILTSSTDAETKLLALRHEATDFLGKPVDPSELALRLRNILAAKAYQDHLIYFDGLTGLPNRRLFLDRVDHLLRSREHAGKPCSVMHLGIDRFKQINDALGHRTGDVLLKSVADRLTKSVRPSDLAGAPDEGDLGSHICRLGSDEFLIIWSGAQSAAEATKFARSVFSSLSTPFHMGDEELMLSCSIGVAMFPEDGDDIESLLASASIAMSHAKDTGGNKISFYSRALNAESSRRLLLENQLRKAIGREELRLHYQPKFDVQTGALVGCEALMRWDHPDIGEVTPSEFIPIAEETDLIDALGGWALRTACDQNAAWQAEGYEPISMAVNVSSRQLRRRRWVDSIRSVLAQTGMDGRHLVIEVTESMLIEDPQTTKEMLHELKKMGIRISVDDFGTGFSSLSYLKELPLDELKIDRSFVAGVPALSDDSAIVNAIIAMAKSLGLTVVAEGVETQAQLRFLQERGCDQFQGFLRARPTPVEKWARWLQRR